MSSKPYSQSKVNELKDILRERGLSLNGTKSELIARLEENDATSVPVPKEPITETAPEVETAELEVKPVVPEITEESVSAAEDTAAEAAGSLDGIEAESAEPSGNTISEQMSDEDVLQKVVGDLEKKIQRTKRFGGDPTELELRLKRINKFGIAAARDTVVQSHQPLEKKRFRRPRRSNRGPKPASA